jgi:hypothetical protein
VRDVVVAILLAIRLMLAAAFLSFPFSNTLHGFNVVTVIGVLIGTALLLSVIHSVVRIRRTV